MPIEENLEPAGENISKESKENPAKATSEEKDALLLDPEFIEETGCAEWTEDEVIHFKEKGFRAFREGEKPILTPTVRPTDYNNDLKRGGVKSDPEVKNYSFCNVEFADGSTIVGHNFTQIQPDTDCIVGENLTLIDCNLSNVRLNPSWTTVDCNTAQFWLVEEDVEGKVKEVVQFLCSHPSELPNVESKVPATAVLAREF